MSEPAYTKEFAEGPKDTSASSPGPWRALLRQRGSWLAASLSFALLGLVLAALLPLGPDPLTPAPALSSRWWIEPIERNAFARVQDEMPSLVVPHARPTLSSVAIAPEGDVALAVGEEGRMLRSTNAGVTWSVVASDPSEALNSVVFAPAWPATALTTVQAQSAQVSGNLGPRGQTEGLATLKRRSEPPCGRRGRAVCRLSLLRRFRRGDFSACGTA
jgi:hypothetical protein